MYLCSTTLYSHQQKLSTNPDRLHAQVCKFDNPPVTPYFWDSSCYMGMKGCLADGKHLGCRFCGAGGPGTPLSFSLVSADSGIERLKSQKLAL